MVVWGITSGALIVILGWMGLSLIMQNLLGHTSTGWRETVPRLVLGLVAAATSYWWCALVIDVAHVVSKYIAAELDVTPRRPAEGAPGDVPQDGGGGERGDGPAGGPALRRIRVLRPLRAGAAGIEAGPHRHPAGPCPHSVGSLDTAPHGGLGTSLA